jgi:hypothetical protein
MIGAVGKEGRQRWSIGLVAEDTPRRWSRILGLAARF